MGRYFGNLKFVTIANYLAIVTLCAAGVLTSATAVAQHDVKIPSGYTQIKSVDDLKRNIDLAKTRQKYVMLVIYAEWDVYSKQHEKEIFSESEVMEMLTGMSRLRADVSHNDEQDKAFLKYLDIVGPPAILFWNKKGLEHRENRLYGIRNYKEFMTHVNKVIKGQ